MSSLAGRRMSRSGGGNDDDNDEWELIDDVEVPRGITTSGGFSSRQCLPPTQTESQHPPQPYNGGAADRSAEAVGSSAVQDGSHRHFSLSRLKTGSLFSRSKGRHHSHQRHHPSTSPSRDIAAVAAAAATSPASRQGFFPLSPPSSSYRRYSGAPSLMPSGRQHRRSSGGSNSAGKAAAAAAAGAASGAGSPYSRLQSHFVSSAMGLTQFGGAGPLSSHLLDWRVPSLSAEQELLQQVFATAYTDACYRCLISQDAAASFSPNETLQLVVDQWRADAFDESQDTLRRVVEQYHHDLLHVVKSVVDAEDAALAVLASEAAGSEENMAAVSVNTSMSGPSAINTSTSSDPSLYQAFMSVGQANIPAMIDCPAVQKAVLHYAMPALGRVLVHQGFFLCFWYSSTGEKLGQLEYRACRWVLEAHVPHVHVPLCYHFRYKGRGVTAISLAPVGENLTAVTEQNPEVAALAQQLASVFSLLPYGSSPGQAGVFAASSGAAAGAGGGGGGGAVSSPFMTMHERSGSASAASAAGVDGEVLPDLYFLPRSVQVHFAQDGRYYFLRNSQWFTPWLNSRQSCDAAMQRLSYVNPRLLAVCGVQVSCRACQRDAFLEENRVALEFMRREVDFGIPRLLHDEQHAFIQQVLRRRRRAAARLLQRRRAARAAAEAEAARHTTAVWVRGVDSAENGAVPSSVPATPSRPHGGAPSTEGGDRGDQDGAFNGAAEDDAESEWTAAEGSDGAEDEEEEVDADLANVYDAAFLDGYSAIPLQLMPFTAASVVSRFSARGYPKSLLGVLLLALLQYPAAPTYMIREVKREILFRGLKSFIRMRTYEARFGVEQLLGRLPHERAKEEDVAPDFIEMSEHVGDDEEDEPIHEDAPPTSTLAEAPSEKRKEKSARVANASLSSTTAATNPLAGARGNSGSHNNSATRHGLSDRHNAANSNNINNNSSSNSVSGPDAASSTRDNGRVETSEQRTASSSRRRSSRAAGALHVSVVSPHNADRESVAGEFDTVNEEATAAAASPSFAQRWRQRPETRRQRTRPSTTPHTTPGDADADSRAAVGEESGVFQRMWRALTALRTRWAQGGSDASVDGITAGQAGNTLEGETAPPRDATTTVRGSSPQPHSTPHVGVGIQNPLAALHNTGFGGRTGNASTATATTNPTNPSSSKTTFSPSWTQGTAASTFFLTWAEFTVTTERVLAAFMQYDGTARPAHVFCDSARRLYEFQELHERDQSGPFMSDSASGRAGGAAEGMMNGGLDDTDHATQQQRRDYAAALWSSADMLNRLYVEQILPFIHRKFRLSVQRVNVLYEPLNEEDRVSVYVRLLDALGVSIADGEVCQTVPVVKDFAPRRRDSGAGTVKAAEGAEEREVDLQERHMAAYAAGAHNVLASREEEREAGGGRGGARVVQEGNPLLLLRRNTEATHASSPAAATPTATESPSSTATTTNASTGSSSSSTARTRRGIGEGGSHRPGGHARTDPLSAPSREPSNDLSTRNTRATPASAPQRHPLPRTERSPSPSPSSSPVTEQRQANGDDEVASSASSSSLVLDAQPRYLLPSWIVCRARGLVHHFLNSFSEAGGVTTTSMHRGKEASPSRRSQRHGRRRHTSLHRQTFDGDINVVSAQVAGLIPLLTLFFNTPNSAFAADPSRPSLPPWPHVAARLLGQLRTVSVTPHLIWDALELYELVDLRTLMDEVRADGAAALSRQPAASSDDTEGIVDSDRDGFSTVSPQGQETHREAAQERRFMALTASNTALPAPRCSLALTLLLRRRTLRSTSDRAILIHVLRRYVAAIRASPALLCFLAPLHGGDDRAAAELVNSLREDGHVDSVEEQLAAAVAGGDDDADASTSAEESEAVYTAVLSTLQEVLLNSDLLLTHFGNPFGAQYRQYTADLVGYLEYNFTMAATTAAANAASPATTNALSGSRSFSTSIPSASHNVSVPHGEARWRAGEPARKLRGLQEELDSTMQHIWKHLNTYCKADSMTAKDALQRAVVLFRLHEAGRRMSRSGLSSSAADADAGTGESSMLGSSASGAANPLGATNTTAHSFTHNTSAGRQPSAGSRGSFYATIAAGGEGGAGGSRRHTAAGGKNSDAAAAPSLALARDGEIEAALQRACDIFLTTEGAGSPVTLRAYANMALYWYSVGCEVEWREWLQRLRRLWREGGPEDIRQLLMATATLGNFTAGSGAGGLSPKSTLWGGSGDAPSRAAAAALGGSSDVLSKGLGGLAGCGEAGPPIPFLQRISYD